MEDDVLRQKEVVSVTFDTPPFLGKNIAVDTKKSPKGAAEHRLPLLPSLRNSYKNIGVR